MHIAYVTETYPPEVNGVSLTAERAWRYLRAVGHAVQLVRPRQRGEGQLDSAAEWRTRGGPIPLYPALRYGRESVDTLRRRWQGVTEREASGNGGFSGRPDLVHVTTPGPLAWAALRAARAEGIATSADFRTNFHAYSRHYRLGWLEPLVLTYLKRLHAMADVNFVPTAELAQQLQQQGFERLQIVGRGVDSDRYSPRWRDEWLRRDWRAQLDDPVLLYVGRLAAEKNVELALDTWEQLRKEQPRLRMVVVGDGPLRRRLKAAHPQAHFAGVQRGTDLARHYASADVFLFPSLTDTFGNVTLEAMASGLAIAAFDTAAAGQHLQDGISGCLAPVPAARRGDRGEKTDGQVAFVAAARRALASAGPGSALRRAAREAAGAADWDHVLRGFEQRLRTVAGAGPHPVNHAALA